MEIPDVFYLCLILLAVILIIFIWFKLSFPSDKPTLPITDRKISSTDDNSAPKKAHYIIPSQGSKAKSSKLKRAGWFFPMSLGGPSSNDNSNNQSNYLQDNDAQRSLYEIANDNMSRPSHYDTPGQ